MEKYESEVVTRIISASWWKTRLSLGRCKCDLVSQLSESALRCQWIHTRNVRTPIASVASVMKEKAAHSQSEPCVLMCSCALGGFRPRASLPRRTNHSGMNIVGYGRG